MLLLFLIISANNNINKIKKKRERGKIDDTIIHHLFLKS
jgi:hypothetical protein